MAKTPQLGVREFCDKTIRHPKEAVANVEGGGVRDLNKASFGQWAVRCQVGKDHGDRRSEGKVQRIRDGRGDEPGRKGNVVRRYWEFMCFGRWRFRYLDACEGVRWIATRNSPHWFEEGRATIPRS